MFEFVKKMVFVAMTFFGFSPSNVNSINVNTNEPVFYPFIIKVNKCCGSCNSINDTYAKLCIPDVVKNINVKVFNLMSRINETRHLIWHETCKSICRLSAIDKDGMKTNADVNVKN